MSLNLQPSLPVDAARSASPAWYLVGPTAVGKSAIALELAGRVDGEIISVDSMQVYRGLDIGTAKPAAAERARVRHHLIDVAELAEAFDAARFVSLAKAADADIRARGKLPIYCGGTGFYLKALLSGLGDAPPADSALRAALEATSLSHLLAELERADPATFEQIDRQNPRRVVRAIEVIRLTGRPFSEQQSDWQPVGAGLPTLIAFSREPAGLRQRIETRVDEMFAAGLVAETRRLLEHGLAGNRTALQAIGYRQVAEHLRGERPLNETIALVKTKTWQFARRQATWLRRHLRPRWISLSEGNSPAEVAAGLSPSACGGGVDENCVQGIQPH